MKVFLTTVPPWFPAQPPLNIPILTGVLRENGHTVIQNDLNLLFYRFLLKTNNLEEVFQEFNSEEIEDKFRILIDLKTNLLENLEKDLSLFKNKNFYNKSKYNEALENIELLLKIYSLKNKDIVFSFGEIEYNFDINDFDEIFQFIVNSNIYNIFDKFFKEECFAEFNTFQPEIVGVSISTLQQFISALYFATFIRDNFPHIKILWGGDFITKNAYLIFKNKLMFEYFDYAITGFGEETILSFIDTIEKKGDISIIKNLIFKGRKKVIFNTFENNINLKNKKYFPDFSGLPLSLYFSPELILPIELSKGCYWKKCNFCEIANMPFQTKPISFIIEEINYLSKKFSSSYFTFVDSSISKSQLTALINTIIDKSINIKWSTMLRPERSLSDIEYLNKLYKSGCKLVMLGLETGNQRILDKMNKGLNVNNYDIIIRNLYKVGIWTHCYFMFNYPGESYEEGLDTIDLLKRNNKYIKSLVVSDFVLPKNSILYKSLLQEDYTNKNRIEIYVKNTFKNKMLDKEMILLKDKFLDLIEIIDKKNNFSNIYLYHIFLFNNQEH